MGITDSSTMSANEIKLFDKYPFDEVTVSDMALTDYIAVKTSDACYIPHSAGRWQKVKFKKAQCPLMDRLTCAIMHLLTNENPLQILVDAVINSGPREDSCRVGSAGVVRRQAVDISPMRRVSQALWLLTTGARESAFRNIKTVAECLAEEIMNAAKGSSNSYAIKKKDELERVAKAN